MQFLDLMCPWRYSRWYWKILKADKKGNSHNDSLVHFNFPLSQTFIDILSMKICFNLFCFSIGCWLCIYESIKFFFQFVLLSEQLWIGDQSLREGGGQVSTDQIKREKVGKSTTTKTIQPQNIYPGKIWRVSTSKFIPMQSDTQQCQNWHFVKWKPNLADLSGRHMKCIRFTSFCFFREKLDSLVRNRKLMQSVVRRSIEIVFLDLFF